MSLEKKIKYPDVYEAQTTYLQSYKKYVDVETLNNTTTEVHSDLATKIKPTFKVRDNETLYYFRPESKVPFNLLWEKKPIIQTNPQECFQMPVHVFLFLSLIFNTAIAFARKNYLIRKKKK